MEWRLPVTGQQRWHIGLAVVSPVDREGRPAGCFQAINAKHYW